MSTALIVFAKAPAAGRAKTRLASALGDAGAAALAERLLERTVAAAASAEIGPVELCVTPALDHPALRRMEREHGVFLTLQGEGDLGERMARSLERALAVHRHAILIGTDAPSLDAALLRGAAHALVHHDAVFVPAFDGGYALVGLARPAPALFSGIVWSTPHVMAETRDRARRAGLRWAELPPVADIDEPADLVHLPQEWRT